MLQIRLDEAQKTVQIESDEKSNLQKNVEKITSEMQEVRDKHEELRAAKQEAVRELLTLQEQHRAEVRILNNSLHEEVSARENLERRLCELRTELERLQAENASEWGKRERLETEKLALERDNKKLRAEIRDLQERSDRKGRPVSNNDMEIRALQQELAERNKEVGEIKHSHTKLKKLLAEANTELGHAVRRAEQYETEVKMRTKNDVNLQEMIKKETIQNFDDMRNELRKEAKKNILKIQEQNKKSYNLRRKTATKYKKDDLVAIKRTQLGGGLKLKSKFMGPYRVVAAKGNDTYDLQKEGNQEGPFRTTSCAEFMKAWPSVEDDELSAAFEANETQDGRMWNENRES